MRRPNPRPALLVALPLLALLVSAIPAHGQTPADGTLYRFSVAPVGESRVDVPLNGQVIVHLVFKDQSRDSPAALAPGAPTNTVLYHTVTFDAVPQFADAGWTVFPPTGFISYGGTEWNLDVPFQVTAQATHTLYPVDIVATIHTSEGGVFFANTTLAGFSLGARSFAAQVGASYAAHPNQIIDVPVKLINLAIAPRSFDMEVADNPCHLGVATQNGNLVRGKSEDTSTVSLITPHSKLWYFSDLCTVTIKVSPSGQKDIFQNVFIGVQVSGGYLDPQWVINLVVILIILLIVFFWLRRRKEQVEEEILGKPQKPWLIPVEKLYLGRLKQKDERAWYVVRHYLMEDEYRSALLWYKAYKKGTRGQRQKEGLVIRQERGYERWKRSWNRAVAKPVVAADRFEARLQKKLDRKAKKAHRKQLGKYNKVMAKMKGAHATQVERAGKQYAKAAAKAQKKGLPVPKRPVVPEPDYPDKPALVPIPLASHKWAKKAAKSRARALRKQGDLEVKFEKADARRLAKVRRKVKRLAKKLDDAEFVNEHPLLKGA